MEKGEVGASIGDALRKYFDEKFDQDVLQNPEEVLRVLLDTFLGKPVVREEAEKAIARTLDGYRQQLALMMIGVAKSKLRRILKTISFIDEIEDGFLEEGRLVPMKTEERTRLYAAAQISLRTDLDYVKQVTFMESELKAMEGSSGKIYDGVAAKSEMKQILSGVEDLPALDSEERDRVRRIIDGLLGMPDVEKNE